MSKPFVAIVGRPNVGKSALLNRLIQSREAIVEDTPGVTRDRLYRDTVWNGREFTLVDTGGILIDDPDKLREAIRLQVFAAIDEADLILFVTDVNEGLHPLDEDVAELLRTTGKKIILVANKADNRERFYDTGELYMLGMEKPYPVSALHGIGTGDLLDQVVDQLPPPDEDEEDSEAVRISIVGRPNVGKSSIMNALLGQDRVIVTDQPGTTRDAIDSHFTWSDRDFVLVDTAGMRRKGKIHEGIEYYSTHRARKAVNSSHVCLLVLDATDPAVMQDKKIAGLLEEKGKAALVVVNKWDLVRDKYPSLAEGVREELTEKIRDGLDFISYAPIIFTSAILKKGIRRIMPLVDAAHSEAIKRIQTPVLTKIFQDAFYFRPPPSYKGDALKLYYVHQAGVMPPTFVLKVNNPKLVHFSYRRYLENQLRRVLKFEGTPIRLIFKK